MCSGKGLWFIPVLVLRTSTEGFRSRKGSETQHRVPVKGYGRGWIYTGFLSRKRSLLKVSVLEEESPQGFCLGRGAYSMFQSWKRSLLKVSVLEEESTQGSCSERGIQGECWGSYSVFPFMKEGWELLKVSNHKGDGEISDRVSQSNQTAWSCSDLEISNRNWFRTGENFGQVRIIFYQNKRGWKFYVSVPLKSFKTNL